MTKYIVAPTDCRTGYQVVTPNGRPVPYCTFRRRESAIEAAAEMNASGENLDSATGSDPKAMPED